MAKNAITTSNIKEICRTFKFGYETREGRHFATVDGKEVEVRFNEDGGLPSGRHAFRERARKASPAFLAEYPKGNGSDSKSEDNKSDTAPVRANLSQEFLDSYPINELEVARDLIDKLIDRKKELGRLEKEIADKEEESGDLAELVRIAKKRGCQLPTGIEERLSKLGEEAADLKAMKSKVKEAAVCADGGGEQAEKKARSGETPQEHCMGHAPTSAATEIEDEPARAPEAESHPTAGNVTGS